eukprot:m.154301 g.154301  ORF g.154301 m.154301 type:complete len:60 (+) comp20783_c0_seq9:239-418(+)
MRFLAWRGDKVKFPAQQVFFFVLFACLFLLGLWTSNILCFGFCCLQSCLMESNGAKAEP